MRAILSVWGHDAIGPNGVHDQSFSLLSVSNVFALDSVVASLATTPALSARFSAPDQGAQLSAGREPFLRGQPTVFRRMACGLAFARGTTVHCEGSLHRALSGFFGLVVGPVRRWR